MKALIGAVLVTALVLFGCHLAAESLPKGEPTWATLHVREDATTAEQVKSRAAWALLSTVSRPQVTDLWIVKTAHYGHDLTLIAIPFTGKWSKL